MNKIDLTQIGLSEKEAQIYISLLELGTATASDISEHSGIRRTTVYQTIESLRDKKIVKEVDVGAVQKFSPNPPQSIVQWCNEKFEIEKDRLANSKQAVEQLEKEFPLTSNLSTRVYQISELPRLMETWYSKTKKMKVFGSITKIINTSEPYQIKRMFKDAAAKNVLSKIITIDTDEAISFSRMNYLYNRETVLLSHVPDPQSSLVVADSVVAIIDHETEIVVVIHQPVLVNLVSTMFEYMWTRCTQMGIHYGLPEDIDKKVYPVQK